MTDPTRLTIAGSAAGYAGGSPLGRPVRQVALVVPDLDAAVRAWWTSLGIGPWNLYTLGEGLTGVTYRGRPSEFRIRLALTFSGELMMELIQPVRGPSIWQESLETHGACLQHIAIYADDFAASAAAAVERGWVAVQTGSGYGRSHDGRFAYYEHPDVAGVIVEVVQAPSVRFPPESTWPPASVG